MAPKVPQKSSTLDLKAPLLEQYQPPRSKLYKAYFDDPTLSDLTVRLSDKTIHVHRIVLCRGSEYFTKLLTGRFQETAAAEIELYDDDSDAMVALLRWLYGLSYTTDDATEQWATMLHNHAMVYVVADKYQIGPLKEEICENMQKIIKSERYQTLTTSLDWAAFRIKNASDFIPALRIIITGTAAQDSQVRKLMMTFLIQNIDCLRQEDELLSLLKESPDLGAEILGHRDLSCEAQGIWCCDDFYCATNVPCCKNCGHEFEPHTVCKYRFAEMWPCELCKTVAHAVCRACNTDIDWERWHKTGDADGKSQTGNDSKCNASS